MFSSRDHKMIWQIREKIDIIKQTLNEANVILNHNDVTLADYCDIPKSTFSGAISDNIWAETLVRKLTDKCKFDPKDFSWVDRKYTDRQRVSYLDKVLEYPGKDTAKNFERHLRKVWGLSQETNLRIDSKPPKLVKQILSSFSVEGDTQQISEGFPLNLYLIFEIEPFRESGFAYSFKKAKLTISPETNGKVIALESFGIGESVDIGGGDTPATIQRRGSKKNPVWLIASKVKELTGYYVLNEPALCELADYELDDSFKVALQANVFDANLSVLEAAHGSNHSDLSENKKAIIEALFAHSLDSKNINGWITIGQHDLEVVEVKNRDHIRLH